MDTEITKLQKNQIYEYFYNFNCFLIYYLTDGYLNGETEIIRSGFIKNMINLSVDQKLNSIDPRFSNMAIELESILDGKNTIDSFLIEYKDFILSFKN